MAIHTGARVSEGQRRGTVLAVFADDAVAKVAWDDGTIGHRPLTALRAIGKDAQVRR